MELRIVREPVTVDLAVVDALLARMSARLKVQEQQRDGAAVFMFTYRLLTETLKSSVNLGRFADPAWMIPLAVDFADLYFEAEAAYQRDPATCVRPWRIFFDVARQGRASSLEVLCLGMNAHIVHDLPIALAKRMREAADVERDASGEWRLGNRMYLRQFDHEMVNEIIKESIDYAQSAISRRYAWWFTVVDTMLLRFDEWLVDRMLRSARSEVWSNALALVTSRSPGEVAAVRAHLVDLCEDNARKIDLVNLIPSSTGRWLARRVRMDFTGAR